MVSYLALWALVLLGSLVLLGLVHIVSGLQNSRTESSSRWGDRPEPGQLAPSFRAVDLAGHPVTSDQSAGGMRALLFVSATCESCAPSLDELRALNHKAGHSVMVVCRGSVGECRDLVARHGIWFPTVVDEGYEISTLYGISKVPMAVLINSEDRIQSYGEPLPREQMEAIFGTPEQAAISGSHQ
jgi:peroxiredoxin